MISLSWDVELLISVVAGVSVAAIVAAARAVWVRRRVPKALSQAVIRKRYVEEILAQSTKKSVTSLDVLSPRFAPRFDDSQLTSLQDAWAAIQTRGRVRVITSNADAAITGGAELVGRGIEVRISPSFSSENSLSHLRWREHRVDDREPTGGRQSPASFTTWGRSATTCSGTISPRRGSPPPR